MTWYPTGHDFLFFELTSSVLINFSLAAKLDDEAKDKFKAKAQSFVAKKLLPKFKDLQFYCGRNLLWSEFIIMYVYRW